MYCSDEEVANYNHERLLSLSQPIATINALHSSELVKKATSDDMPGLELTIFLAKSARIMLTMNLWTGVGLCNGSTGIVRDLFMQIINTHLTFQLLLLWNLMITGAHLLVNYSWVPICPIAINSSTLDGVHERQQLPLKLAWAMTIHKSQGLTLKKAWINISQTEKTTGISYVGISRVKSLSSAIVESMTFVRLTNLKKSVN